MLNSSPYLITLSIKKYNDLTGEYDTAQEKSAPCPDKLSAVYSAMRINETFNFGKAN